MTRRWWTIRQQMCDIGHRIWLRGYCAANDGNHSVKVDDDRILITPTGISKGFMQPEMMCLVDLSGTPVESNEPWRASSELKIHLAAYRHRPDIRSVVHSHPPHATALAIAGLPVPEAVYPETEMSIGRIDIAPYGAPSTDDLPRTMVQCMHVDTQVLLLGNHGSVSFGTDLQQAYDRLEIIDAYCRIMLLVRQLGGVQPLTAEQMQELLALKKRNYGLDDRRIAEAEAGTLGERNDAFFGSSPVRLADDQLQTLAAMVADRLAGRGR